VRFKIPKGHNETVFILFSLCGLDTYVDHLSIWYKTLHRMIQV